MPRPQAARTIRRPRAPKRGRFTAIVEHNLPVCREHYRLRLRIDGPFPPSQPGQFIQLGCRPPEVEPDLAPAPAAAQTWPPKLSQPELLNAGALLRRPLSLAGRGDDQHGAWLEAVYRVIGIGTNYLAGLQPGAAVDLIGPLGHGFDLPKGKRIALLVGGGVGLPPMFYLAPALRRAGWDALAIVGAMTRDLLAVSFVSGVDPDRNGLPRPCVAEFAGFGFPTIVTTDDGTCGLPGRLTVALEQLLRRQTAAQINQTVIFTCGPEPMMRAVAQLAATCKVSCQVCMEQAMACGMGTCQSCVVKVADPGARRARPGAQRPWRYRLACGDGPVFDARTIIW
jgi:dihydroorotate dehydrogenase electron transfer subunit